MSLQAGEDNAEIMEAGGAAPTMLLHVLIGEPDRAGCDVAIDAMSPELWSRLPKELVDLVLPHLPLKSKHRSRCVSKHWKRMLTTYGLRKLCGVSFVWPAENLGQAPVASSDLSLLAIGEQSVNPENSKVGATPIRVDLSFLPPRFRRWLKLPTACAIYGGFVVVSDMDDKGPSFCVFNPMTRRWRQLPRLSCRDLNRLVRALVYVTDDGMEVFVVCTQFGESVPVVAQYCTKTKEWEICTDITPMDQLRLGRDGALQLRHGNSMEWSLLGWLWRLVGPLPEEVVRSDKILLTCHEKNAYLVVDLPSSEYKTASIWKMAALSSSDICLFSAEASHYYSDHPWQQVSVLPQELLNGEQFSLDEVKVAGSYICVTSKNRLYAFSVPDGTWKVIPAAAGFFREFLVPDMETVI